jgi:hypothetical protein
LHGAVRKDGGVGSRAASGQWRLPGTWPLEDGGG